MTLILDRPTDHSITVSVLAARNLEAFVEYGAKPGAYTGQTAAVKSEAGQPFEVLLDRLTPDTRYYYRLRCRESADAACTAGAESSFHTQRPPGSVFTFGVQGDSHPERLNRMYRPDLYLRTMENVRKDGPDFHILPGDDFSLDPLYNRGRLNAEEVAQIYASQRRFLGLAGSSSPPVLVNGNHEQAAAYLLNGAPNSPPVLDSRTLLLLSNKRCGILILESNRSVHGRESGRLAGHPRPDGPEDAGEFGAPPRIWHRPPH